MTFTRLVALIAALTVFAPFSHGAGKSSRYSVGDLVVHEAWSRATPKSAKVGAGYLVIENRGSTADRLIKVETAIAGHAEIHEMKMTDGVMKMRPLADGVEIPAGGKVTLKPGANHIMFMKLNGPIRKGTPFKATLTFEKAGVVEVTFRTVKIGGSLPRGSH